MRCFYSIYFRAALLESSAQLRILMPECLVLLEHRGHPFLVLPVCALKHRYLQLVLPDEVAFRVSFHFAQTPLPRIRELRGVLSIGLPGC